MLNVKDFQECMLDQDKVMFKNLRTNEVMYDGFFGHIPDKGWYKVVFNLHAQDDKMVIYTY